MVSKTRTDISISVTALYMKAMGFWLANDRAEKQRRDAAMVYTVALLSFAIFTEVRDFYFSWGDLAMTIYTTCNIATITMGLFKMLILFVHKMKVLELVRYAKVNFWQANYVPAEQLIVEKCRRTCISLICIFNLFAQGTVVSYIIKPIMANIGKNESERSLPFNMWVDWPTYRTPYYEIIFTLQILAVSHVGVCYIGFDNLMCILNLHIGSQFRILQHRLVNLHRASDRGKENEITKKVESDSSRYYRTLKEYIRQHQALIDYCKRLEEVFTLIVLGQVLLFSLLMCLDGYLILMDSAPTVQRLTFLFHITGCTVQLLMFTYSCDFLIRESGNVANAAYESLWTILPMDATGKSVRNDIVLVILRSQLPCCLTAGGFFVVSLQTYTTVLSTAVSYFTLLAKY